MRRKFEVSFRTWNEQGVETVGITFMEDDVSDTDLATVELALGGLLQARLELGQEKLLND